MADGNTEGGSVAAQLKQGVRSNLLAAAATGIAGGIVAALLAAWGLVETIPGRLGLTPTGAVMAFDLGTGCPAGWEVYKEGTGRFIVGATTEKLISSIPNDFARDVNGNAIKEKTHGRAGGEQSHQIKLGEIPKHQHQTQVGVKPGQSMFGDAQPTGIRITGAGESAGFPTSNTGFAGNNEPLNMLPPYVALWWCKKE